MRKVPHPKRLYIQINDEDEKTLSFSFSDDTNANEGLDPNAFDSDTILRATQMLANVFYCLDRLMKNAEPIKSLDEDEEA